MSWSPDPAAPELEIEAIGGPLDGDMITVPHATGAWHRVRVRPVLLDEIGREVKCREHVYEIGPVRLGEKVTYHHRGQAAMQLNNDQDDDRN